MYAVLITDSPRYTDEGPSAPKVVALSFAPDELQPYYGGPVPGNAVYYDSQQALACLEFFRRTFPEATYGIFDAEDVGIINEDNKYIIFPELVVEVK